MCTSFKSASVQLCQSLALTARRICTETINPSTLAPLMAGRLIALNKNPGVRPIGVGDVARRIIAKAILNILKKDIQDVVGSAQLCVGQISGIEAAVHAVQSLFECPENEALLLVDASNAFNSLNRKTALINIQRLCPSIATVLINTYRAPTELFVDGDVILSQEGTTQGDPLAMIMYALATIPLIRRLKDSVNDVSQVWYADDASGSGRVLSLRKWWDKISTLGPHYGYYTNAVKTWLITKKDHYQAAREAFADTKVQVTYEGRPYLGVPLGTEDYCHSFVMEKVEQWTKELELLSSIATSQPHAAYAAFTHGLMSKWSYLSRTTPNINSSLQPLETTIRTKLIPALTGRAPPNDTERELLALPARLGGLALANPVKLAEIGFYASSKITAPLSQEIMSQTLRYPDTIIDRQIKEKTVTHQERRQLSNWLAQSSHESLTPSLKRSMDLAQEKGASSWLTSLPIKEFGFSLHKGAFRDALALRYNWEPSHLPAKCDCGKTFTVEHALTCPKGGLPTVRHNEIRDLTANLLSEVCKDVRIEPELQPVTGETFTGSL